MGVSTKVLSFLSQLNERGLFEVIENLSDQAAMETTEAYSTHNYHPLPVNIVKGRGAKVEDGNGKDYIDCIGSYSAVAHGHLNEFVTEAIHRQLEKITLTSRAMYNSELAVFCHALAEYCSLDMVCPMNTGAEANETAIKLARKWGYTRKNIPLDQAEIIVVDGNFHGRTTTIVGFSSEEQYYKYFGPKTPGFKMVPYGDVDALQAAITPNTCAFMAEPIQAEGGVLIPPDGYLAGARKICDENNVLLIWDEVQTGFARTGARMGWMHEDARPDIIAVGKPLGGGILPVAAAVGQKHVMEVFEPGDHGSTFGGNSLSAVVGVAALMEMEREDYAGQSKRKGDLAKQWLQDLGHDCIIELRGRGLLIGIEFDAGFDTKKLSHRFIEEGVLTKETRHRTFRLSPPIVISDAELEEAVLRIDRAIRSV